MTVLLGLLTGFSFIEATSLFGEASRTAKDLPELARGMTPLDGILAPTLGGLYLCTTLLFPFVAIRAIGQDKESGALKFSLQWPISPLVQITAKALATGAAWCITLLLPLSGFLIWYVAGGHLALLETINLLLGHALYAMLVVSIAFFAVAITESTSTAAIVTLAATIGFWVLDFMASGSTSNWLRNMGELSPTVALKLSERGLFSLPHTLQLIVFGLGFITLSAILIHPGTALRSKVKSSALTLLLFFVLLILAQHASYQRDVSEDRRNSFNPVDESALIQMNMGLKIIIYLAPQDSRARELETNVIGKLKRLVPNIDVQYGDIPMSSPFSGNPDDRYGMISYEYLGRHAESRSNSSREILPILHELAGTQVHPFVAPHYPGYPLAIDKAVATIWFYVVSPVITLFIVGYIFSWRRTPNHLKGIIQ